MKPEITNNVTRLDIDKITNVVLNAYNNTPLIEGVYKNDDEFQIDGIAHLSEEIISEISEKAYIKAASDTIYSTLFIDDVDKAPTKKVRITSIEELEQSLEPVYDISMKGNNHFFFGNDILLHNTDSVYFSAKKPFIEAGIDFDWNDRDKIIDLYYTIGQEVGKSFPPFMMEAFNVTSENAKIIDADLEMIGSRGLFLKKKRYGILKYWEDGFRLDVKGKPGKLKAMGVEIKRSDTPKYIQVFLEDVFISLLSGAKEKDLRDKVLEFKRTFGDKPAWTKGSPKTVKNLSNKTEEYDETGKCGVGHVLAAINWNTLRDIMKDITVPEIVDGDKTIVCKLLPNPYRMTSISYPTTHMEVLPQWFRNLPFDNTEMGKIILRQKLDNIFGILNMNLGIDENVETTFSNTDLFGWD